MSKRIPKAALWALLLLTLIFTCLSIPVLTYRHPLGAKFRAFQADFPIFPGASEAKAQAHGYSVEPVDEPMLPFCHRYRVELEYSVDLDVTEMLKQTDQDRLSKAAEIAMFYRKYIASIGFDLRGGTHGNPMGPNDLYYVDEGGDGVMVLHASLDEWRNRTVLRLHGVISGTYTDTAGTWQP